MASWRTLVVGGVLCFVGRREVCQTLVARRFIEEHMVGHAECIHIVAAVSIRSSSDRNIDTDLTESREPLINWSTAGWVNLREEPLSTPQTRYHVPVDRYNPAPVSQNI